MHALASPSPRHKPAPSTRAVARSRTRRGCTDFDRAFHGDAADQADWVRQGLAPADVEAIARDMAIPREHLLSLLGLTRASVDRKARENRPLSPKESARVLGLARLVGQVAAMVKDSGATGDFCAAAWVAQWLERPLPALGGRPPAELMDSIAGQQQVARLVARMAGGAYS